MIETEQPLAPIPRGFAYRLRVHAEGGAPLFPAGAALKAELRNTPRSPTAIATLTTENGGIVRVDDRTIDLVLNQAATAKAANVTAALDLVRTDATPDVWLGVQIFLPVVQPITQPEPLP